MPQENLKQQQKQTFLKKSTPAHLERLELLQLAQRQVEGLPEQRAQQRLVVHHDLAQRAKAAPAQRRRLGRDREGLLRGQAQLRGAVQAQLCGLARLCDSMD